MDANDAVMHSAFEHDERAHASVSFEPASVCDLQPGERDHVALHESGDGDLVRPEIGLDVRLRPDQQLAVAIDAAAERSHHAAATANLQASRQRILLREHCHDRRLDASNLAAAIHCRRFDCFCAYVSHPLPPDPYPLEKQTTRAVLSRPNITAA